MQKLNSGGTDTEHSCFLLTRIKAFCYLLKRTSQHFFFLHRKCSLASVCQQFNIIINQ